MNVYFLGKGGNMKYRSYKRLGAQRKKFKVLEVLATREAISIDELSEIVQLSRTNVKKLTSSLMLSGLVSWIQQEEQRLAITEAGSKFWKGLIWERARVLEREDASNNRSGN